MFAIQSSLRISVFILIVIALTLGSGVATHSSLAQGDPIPGYLAQVDSANLEAVATDLVTLYGPRQEETYSPFADDQCTINSAIVYPKSTLEMSTDYAVSLFEEMGYSPAEITLEQVPAGAGSNVIVTKVGDTYPNVFIEFSAHIDSVVATPGGNDNASGSTAVIELARVLKDYPSRYSMRFILWVGEEFDVDRGTAYFGSAYHVQQLIASGEQIKAGLVLDHIGWPYPGDPTGLLNGVSYNNAESERIADMFEQVSLQYGIEIGFDKVNQVFNSDEHSYWDQGFTAVSSGGGWLYYRPEYHDCGDTADNIDFTNVLRTTQQNLAVGLKLDAEDFDPSGTPVPTPTPTNTATATPTNTPGGPTPTPTTTSVPPSGFPSTNILDKFDRADGVLGDAWGGATTGYGIQSNSLDVGSGDAILWNQTSFGPEQEIFVTLKSVDAGGTEHDLLLKSQSATTSLDGVLEVWYDAVNQQVQVWTYSPAQNWVKRGADIRATLAAGDQFGARTTADGQVEVYRNGVLLGSRDVSAWNFAANGGYVGFWFVNAGNATLDDFGGGTVGSPVDTTPPEVTIAAPVDGATVAGTTEVTADATDDVGVASVQFQIDGADLGSTLTTAPYTLNWDTTAYADGTYQLTAIAVDAAGNTATSVAVNVTVDNSVPDTTPPEVTIAAPVDGATVTGTTEVTADATDDVGVASVQFQIDGADLGSTLTTAPYTLNWDTTAYADGTYQLTAIAVDAAGNTATSVAVNVTVDNSVPDTTPPEVTIAAPVDGATVTGTTEVTADATDDVGVASVQFQIDGADLGSTLTTAPYTLNWDTTAYADGTYQLTAIAVDAAGNTATSVAVNVTVDNSVPDTIPPEVTIAAPVDGATVTGTTEVTADATDDVGVASVQFQIDGADLGSTLTTAPYTLNWDTTAYVDGTYQLTAIAVDAAGNTATSAAVNVTVDNSVPDTTPPEVTIAAPVDGATVAGITEVTADATDDVGVASVQFQIDGADLSSTLTTAPYTLNWDTTAYADGTYQLTAIAVDAAGNTATSVTVNVTVDNSVPPSGFPVTSVLDNFDRGDGVLGLNWNGATDGYSISSNRMDVGSGAAVLWQETAYGAVQEIFVTLTNVDAAGAEQDLLLKSQSAGTAFDGVLEVWYDPVNQRVQVWTYSPTQNWVQRGADIAVTFEDGDQFGARAKADGTVEVYRNGTLLGTRDASEWDFAASGGYIGLWFINSDNARLDDFGGG